MYRVPYLQVGSAEPKGVEGMTRCSAGARRQQAKVLFDGAGGNRRAGPGRRLGADGCLGKAQ